jgi:hypothetical protein
VRSFLHAHRLAFEHPRTQKVVRITSPLPGDLAAVLARGGDAALADELQGLAKRTEAEEARE